MVKGLGDRRIVPFLIALVGAALLLEVLIRGNYCLVPSALLGPGEVGTAETSVHGVPSLFNPLPPHGANNLTTPAWVRAHLLAVAAKDVDDGLSGCPLSPWTPGASPLGSTSTQASVRGRAPQAVGDPLAGW